MVKKLFHADEKTKTTYERIFSETYNEGSLKRQSSLRTVVPSKDWNIEKEVDASRHSPLRPLGCRRDSPRRLKVVIFHPLHSSRSCQNKMS